MKAKYEDQTIPVAFELKLSTTLGELRTLAVQAFKELQVKELIVLTYEASDKDTITIVCVGVMFVEIILTNDEFGIQRWITNMQGRIPYFVVGVPSM